MVNICNYCLSETKNKYYCSLACYGFNMRGKPRGESLTSAYGTAKNHIRIRETNLIGESKRTYLHRFVVDNLIRPLKKNEIVHHIDENKFNNSENNLQILTNQSEHKSLHWQIDREKTDNLVLSEIDFETIDDYILKW